MHGCVPTTSDAQVRAFWYDVDNAFVTLELIYGFSRAVSRAVVYHDEIEGERRFLLQHRANGIANGALTIADRNDDRSLHSKLAIAEVHLVIFVTMQISVQSPQMTRASPFHFYLTTAIARVDIIELLLSAQPRIALHLGIEELIHMQGQLLTADEESEVIESRKLIIVQILLSDIFLQHFSTEEQHRTELEIIANRTELVVNKRHRLPLSIWGKRVVVCIEHQGLAVLSDSEESGEGVIAELQGVVLTI